MNKVWLVVVGCWLLVVSCDKNTIENDPVEQDTTFVSRDTLEFGIAEKLKEIAAMITHKKDSVIANRDSTIAELQSKLEDREALIVELRKVEYIEDHSDNIGELHNGYTLVVKVTKDDRYEKYPNRVHGEVRIKDKVFHHYTIYSADCSIQRAMYDVRMNLRKWVDK